MSYSHRVSSVSVVFFYFQFAAIVFCSLLWSVESRAAPITLDVSLAGNIDFVVTGGTLRTQSNAGNACAVTNGPVSANLSGIPAGASIRTALLYWGGSGTTVDSQVTFDSNSIAADKTFTENFNDAGYDLWYFGGVADVTAIVAAKGNGSYSFADLTVTTTDQGGGATYCSAAAVVAGWGLLVVFEHPDEDFRVVNIFDGLRWYRGSSITLTPSNFQIPVAPINGKLAILTWEGDVENSAPLNGFSENLLMNGTPLTDGLNPLNNQFNNTINVLGSNTAWGVDLDVYPIGAYLTAGDTSASTVYSSGADLVLLAMEAISVTNVPVSDLGIVKTLSSLLQSGGSGQYRLRVTNYGPLSEPGVITVTDTLDARLSYSGFTGSGWSCSALGQNVTCTHPGPLAVSATLPDLFINVNVQSGIGGQSITNTATVDGANFDNIAANNSSSTVDYVYGPTSGNKALYLYPTSATAGTLQRVVPVANATQSIQRGNTDTRYMRLNLSPVLQQDLTINGNISLHLCLRREGNNSNRNVIVSFHRADTDALVGTASATYTFNNTAWNWQPFTMTHTGPTTIPSGVALRLRITNSGGSDANRQIGVTSNGAGTLCAGNNAGGNSVSHVAFNTSTVINIDDIEVYNAASPAGFLVNNTVEGATVYVRSTVSDPFGFADINNNTTVEVLNASNILVSGPYNNTAILSQSGATKVFEYAVTMPNDWQDGPFTLRVTANEGTEGTIFHQDARVFTLTDRPLLVISKISSQPSVVPEQDVDFQITVSNTSILGTGDATNVVVTDELPQWTAFKLGSLQVTDGPPPYISSALTLVSTEYFNGITWAYIPVSGGGGAPLGYDANVQQIRLTGSGFMPPNGAFRIEYTLIAN